MPPLRLDRMLTIASAAAGRPFGGTSEAPGTLPILMYHSVSDDPEPGISPYYRLCTSPNRFAEQMRWLREAGYQGMDLASGLDSSRTGTVPNGAKPVVITFDDGFRDFHDAALPALEQNGFSATVYLPTAFIGDQRRRFVGRECMTWDEVNRCTRAGITFGSHTVNHPVLVSLEWETIRKELTDSRREIEDRISRPANHFAHPYAYPQAKDTYTRRFDELLRECGYLSNVTTIVGRARANSNPFRLPRLPVNEADDRRLLLLKLDGYYDWFSLVQKAGKKLRSVFRPA